MELKTPDDKIAEMIEATEKELQGTQKDIQTTVTQLKQLNQAGLELQQHEFSLQVRLNTLRELAAMKDDPATEE